jgi:hypothetical protein
LANAAESLLAASFGARRMSGPLPAANHDSTDDYDLGGDTRDHDGDYLRRLQEMADAHRRLEPHDRQQKLQISREVPSLQDLQRFKSNSEASCSSSGLRVTDSVSAADEPTWRALLTRMREVQQVLRSDHILTDTFGWGPWCSRAFSIVRVYPSYSPALTYASRFPLAILKSHVRVCTATVIQ